MMYFITKKYMFIPLSEVTVEVKHVTSYMFCYHKIAIVEKFMKKIKMHISEVYFQMSITQHAHNIPFYRVI